MPHLFRISLSLLAIYFIWGSTYLGIRFTVDAIPPLLAMGSRLVIAGTGMLLWAWMTKRRIRSVEIPGLIATSLLLFAIPLSCLAYAELEAPSHLLALCNAGISIWIALFTAILNKQMPRVLTCVGIMASLSGLYLLLKGDPIVYSDVPLYVYALVLTGTGCWALGSICISRMRLPKSAAASCGMQQLLSGLILCAAFCLIYGGEGLALNRVTHSSLIATCYLIIAGSWIAYPCYLWTLRHTPPLVATTFAYVNPMVALYLGWSIGQETLSPAAIPATVGICSGVAMIGYSEAS